MSSTIEIERKFLVTSTRFKDLAFKKERITQGFLSTDKQRTVRVRLKGDQGFLTIKGPSTEDGLSRFEWEKSITVQDAKDLLKLCKKGIIDKIRYQVDVEGFIFEVDYFLNDNEGLIVAEIELQTENQEFFKPDWLGEEVTGIIKYYNSQLSLNPYKNW
ncbi:MULTISPECIES: CYTH domain-containing protein [Mesoflavibacter]|uniref:CYTH domain-containing protein n=1 Tax=Mesoflavibacter profundi TaxID=2708110 RepID=A0ABT4S1V3_9FLAO|nr:MULTISPECIES: CYTH domain-containing protein [Mesoflavibacter]MDA0178037.1 CYTH domain-containing protein [Mesoflavibacter profundi]QIJ88998.1 hypothetical protein C7H62_1189 [Mesoflavibacter sp. HG96]QIJ91726.1 hypothetical protein C7H56_1189 [Mesoflavibacter sp. HG37]